MAKSRFNSKRMRAGQRVNPGFTTDVLPRNFFTPTLSLGEIEDNRHFHPEDDERDALNTRGRPGSFSVTPFHTVHPRSVIARSYLTGAPRGFQVPVGVKFSNPLSVVACIRRKMRRAVLFAKGKTGKGAKSPRHRTWRSNVGCR